MMRQTMAGKKIGQQKWVEQLLPPKLNGDHESVYLPQKSHTLQVKINPKFVTEKGQIVVGCTEVAYTLLKAIYATLDHDQEHFVMLALDDNNQLQCYKVLVSGAQDGFVLDLKMMLRVALLMGAAWLIVAHNHPSGCVDPSPEDLGMTRLIALATALVDVVLCDHIIYGEKNYNSLMAMQPALFYSDEPKLF